MSKLFIGLVLLFGAVWFLQPTAVSAAILYRVDRQQSGRLTSPPGRPVPGLADVREVSSAQVLSDVSATERRSAQANVRYHALLVPNDPQYPLQWNLSMMNMAAAWDADTTAPLYGGDPKIIVAVLDTGLASSIVGGAYSVPDFLSTSIWTNTGEIPGDGIDNDHNGYVDDVAGWNFVANNARPIDDNGHGTHIATTIAAQMNNGLATAGMASNVTIMPLKVLDFKGDGSTSTLTAAVTYAVAHGANIINLSLGGDQDDPLFHQAIQNAVAQGVVVIGAAGNSGAGTVTFPASYNEVISVGAIQVDRTKAPYANYGARLDLVAPGGNDKLDQNADGQPDGILSSTCTDATCTNFASMFLVGTSQAAAQVSAVAALLESCGATAGAVRSLLTSTAQDLGTAGRDDIFGYGLVDATAAMSASGCTSAPPVAPSLLVATAGAKALTPLVSGRAYPYNKPVISWSGTTGATYEVSVTRGLTILAAKRQTATNYVPSITTEGDYVLHVRTVDAVDRVSESQTFTYRYQKPAVLLSTGAKILVLNNLLQTTRTVTTSVSSVGMRVSGGALVNGQSNRLVIAPQSSGPTLMVTDALGKKLFNLQPFGPKFSGTMSTSLLKQADGRVQIIVATATQGAAIAWFSATGKKLGQNQVFAGDMRGIEIAAGDLNGDGSDELVVAQAAGSDLRIFNADRQRLAVLTPRGKTFKQGWAIAVGDTDGDGRAEIMATPHLATSSRKVLRLAVDGRELGSWKVSGMSGTVPLLIQTADTNGDGLAEILLAPRQGAITLQRWSGTGTLLQKTTVASKLNNSLGQL